MFFTYLYAGAADIYLENGDQTLWPPLDRLWNDLTGGTWAPLTLTVKGREVILPGFQNGVARAPFWELCGRALGPADYLAVAEAVRVLILEDVPQLGPYRSCRAR